MYLPRFGLWISKEKRVEMIGLKDKRQITAVFCATIQGDFFPIQLIFKGKTSRCHPNFKFPEWWHITHSPKRWSNEVTMLQYINHIILPYIKGVREMLGDESLSALVVMDNFKGKQQSKCRQSWKKKMYMLFICHPMSLICCSP